MATTTITIPITFTVEMDEDDVQYADSIDVIDKLDAEIHVILSRNLVGTRLDTYVQLTDEDDKDVYLVVQNIQTPYPDECGGVQY